MINRFSQPENRGVLRNNPVNASSHEEQKFLEYLTKVEQSTTTRFSRVHAHGVQYIIPAEMREYLLPRLTASNNVNTPEIEEFVTQGCNGFIAKSSSLDSIEQIFNVVKNNQATMTSFAVEPAPRARIAQPRVAVAERPQLPAEQQNFMTYLRNNTVTRFARIQLNGVQYIVPAELQRTLVSCITANRNSPSVNFLEEFVTQGCNGFIARSSSLESLDRLLLTIKPDATIINAQISHPRRRANNAPVRLEERPVVRPSALKNLLSNILKKASSILQTFCKLFKAKPATWAHLLKNMQKDDSKIIVKTDNLEVKIFQDPISLEDPNLADITNGNIILLVHKVSGKICIDVADKEAGSSYDTWLNNSDKDPATRKTMATVTEVKSKKQLINMLKENHNNPNNSSNMLYIKNEVAFECLKSLINVS